MKIGINLLFLIPGKVGGSETYASGLLSGLAEVDDEDEFIIFVNREAAAWPIPQKENFFRVVCPVNAVSRFNRYLYEQGQFRKLLEEHNIELVHSLGYVAPLFPGRLSAVSILDLNYKNFGDQLPVIRRLTLSFFVSQSAKRSDHIITISAFARDQIISYLNIPSERVSVTLLAPKIKPGDNHLPKALLKGVGQAPYIIAYSSFSQNKNIPRLVEAFLIAKKKYQLPHRLVLVGHKPSSFSSATLEKISEEEILFTGYLDEDSLKCTLMGADLLVFPSTYEGFGLPILEAMEAGVPVVCSSAASLPEVAGKAAIYFNPFSVDEIAANLSQMALDKAVQEVYRQKGFNNVKRFSWRKTARQTLQIYRKVHEQAAA